MIRPELLELLTSRVDVIPEVPHQVEERVGVEGDVALPVRGVEKRLESGLIRADSLVSAVE